MTPIYGRLFCNDPCNDPVTPRYIFAALGAKCNDPCNDPVTLFGPVLLCKPLVCNGCNDVTDIQILDGRCR